MTVDACLPAPEQEKQRVSKIKERSSGIPLSFHDYNEVSRRGILSSSKLSIFPAFQNVVPNTPKKGAP
jgi:hypothetical protein